MGFSEPDAGSDLASLRTRAELEGDYYVLNGQKLWNNSYGADFMLAFVRTGPAEPKHSGISCFVVPLDTEGIEIRQITEISGEPEFTEVFFVDARIPVSCRIGQEGQGWSIAMTTLAYDRGPADIGHVAKFGRLLSKAQELQQSGGARADESLKHSLLRAKINVEIFHMHVRRSLSARDEKPPGPEGSVDKLFLIRVEQELLHTIFDLAPAHIVTGSDSQLLWDYYRARSASIVGGTEQIQRNIVATRALGLPVAPKTS
jgi:alkylation response protein AidB-like acyl-CoA dehydrogenase